MILPLPIDDLIRRQEHLAAWRAVVNALAGGLTVDGRNTWLDQLAGRAADDSLDAAPLLWRATRSALGRAEDARLFMASVEEDERQLQEFAARLFLPTDLKLSKDGRRRREDEHRAAASLMSGACALCRAALAARHLSDDDHRGRVRDLLHLSAQAYTRFWAGDADASTPWAAEPLTTASGAALLHEIIEAAERGLPDVSDSRHIAWGMVRVALAWLFPPTTELHPRAEHTTVLLYDELNEEGRYAELHVEETLGVADCCGAVFAPHPVFLGVLPLDAAWRNSFDRAAAWVRSSGVFRACTWRLSFPSASRPYVLRGPSASGAAAVALAVVRDGLSLDSQRCISAQVLDDGHGGYKFADVGYKPEKVWQKRLRYKSAVLVAAPSRGAGKDAASWKDFVSDDPAMADAVDKQGLELIGVAGLGQAIREMTGQMQLLAAYLHGQAADMSLRLRRFLPRRLLHSGQVGAFDEVFQLHVPLVAVPRREARRLRDEQDRRLLDDVRRGPSNQRGNEDDRPSRHRPSQLDLDQEEKKLARDVDTLVADWLGPSGGSDSAIAKHASLRVLLGGVGSVKTWSTIRTAWQVGCQSWQARGDLQRAWLPVWIHALDLAELVARTKAHSPPDCDLVRHVVVNLVARRIERGESLMMGGTPRRVDAGGWLRRWLEANRVVLIVDSIDEAISHSDALRQFWDAWQNSAAGATRPVLAASRHGHLTTREEDDHGWELAAFTAPQLDTKAFVYNWFGSEPAGTQASGRLWNEVKRNPTLEQMIRVPLLAALVSWLAESRPDEQLPARQGDLIETVLRALLLEACRDAETAGKSPLLVGKLQERHVAKLLDALGELAYETFDGQRWKMSETQLNEALKKLLKNEEFDLLARNDDRDALISSLTGRLGIFTRLDAVTLEILHHSVGEFVLARHVTRLARNWAPDKFAKWLREHVSHRSRDIRWREVWILLAGRLTNEKQNSLLDWLRTSADDELGWQTYIGAAAEAHQLPRLIEVFADPARGARSATARAIAGLGAAATPALPGLLGILIDDFDSDIKTNAADAIAGLGPAAASALPDLRRCLRGDFGNHATLYAAHAIAGLGAVATPALPELLEILRGDFDGNTKEAVARAIAELGTAAASVLPELLQILRGDFDYASKWAAAKAIAAPGIATPSALAELLKILNAKNDYRTKESAAMAIAAMGEAAVSALPSLREILGGKEDDETKVYAVKALRGLGATAAPALPELLRILRGPFDNETRSSAAAAIAVMESAAASAVPDLREILRANFTVDDTGFAVQDGVTRFAAQAIAGLGGAAAPALPELSGILCGGFDMTTRYFALDAFEGLGAAGAPALANLRELLRGEVDVNGECLALLAIAAMGDAAAPALPELLAVLQRNSNGSMPERQSEVAVYSQAAIAARAIGALGTAAVPALPDLLRILRGPFSEVTKVFAARAITGLGTAAAEAVPEIREILRGKCDRNAKDELARVIAALGRAALSALPDLIDMLRQVELLGDIPTRYPSPTVKLVGIWKKLGMHPNPPSAERTYRAIASGICRVLLTGHPRGPSSVTYIVPGGKFGRLFPRFILFFPERPLSAPSKEAFQVLTTRQLASRNHKLK